MAKDPPRDLRRLKDRDESETAPATGTCQQVHGEHSAHQVRPAPAPVVGRGVGAWRFVGRRVGDGRRRARYNLPSPRRPRGQHTVVEQEIHARARDEHGEPRQECRRREGDVGGPVGPRRAEVYPTSPVGMRRRRGSARGGLKV